MSDYESDRLPAVPIAWNAHVVSIDASPAPSMPLLHNVLNEAVDENPVQTFLASHPHLLTCLLPPGRDAWCWDRPRFGSELVPDFLICTRNSTGFEWVMVELESPTAPPLIQSGVPGAKLRDAQNQIRDWRIWLRDNIAYAQRQLGFDGLSADAQGVIVIGRRCTIVPRYAKKWRELSTDRTRIMTYDRLMERCSIGRTIIGDNHG